MRLSLNRLWLIIPLAFFILISTSCTNHSQSQETVEPHPETNINSKIKSTSERDVTQSESPSYDNDEGITRNRSHFPKDPERFQPMPIPDPTKREPKQSGDDPERPESHTIKNEKAKSPNKVNM